MNVRINKKDLVQIRPGVFRLKAKAKVRRDPDYDSKMEEDYADYLHLLERAEEIRCWARKPCSFILPGENNQYTPDFLVVLPDGRIEFHETKGWSKNMREGIQKLKTAAGLHRRWARFVLVKQRNRRWIEKEVA